MHAESQTPFDVSTGTKQSGANTPLGGYQGRLVYGPRLPPYPHVIHILPERTQSPENATVLGLSFHLRSAADALRMRPRNSTKSWRPKAFFKGVFPSEESSKGTTSNR